MSTDLVTREYLASKGLHSFSNLGLELYTPKNFEIKVNNLIEYLTKKNENSFRKNVM